MSPSPTIDRRTFLLTLAAAVPAAGFLSAPTQALAADGNAFMAVSRVIAGRSNLSPSVAQRIQLLLATRIEGFDEKLAGLEEIVAKAGGKRDMALSSLNAEQMAFAVAIAKPWYLGYVGTPSGMIMIMNDDDAEFVTYLDAQAYELVVADLPRPSYPPGGRGWWAAPPEGVTPPVMPTEITDWNWQPEGANGHLAEADPAWRAYALGQFDTLAEARAAL